jgi:hypothetical protein
MKLAIGLLICFLILFFYSPPQSSGSLSSKESSLKVTPASLKTTPVSPPKKVGTLTAKINGTQHAGDLFEEGAPYSYEVTSGNKNYEIRLEWKYINSASGIKEDIIDLSERNVDLAAEYINFNVPDKYVVSAGNVFVKNDGKKVSGTFSFTATVDGYSRNSNSTLQFSDGTFEINYTK